MEAKDYRQIAKTHEVIFRNVLNDLAQNKDNRPNGFYFPRDLNTNATIDEIFNGYTVGKRNHPETMDAVLGIPLRLGLPTILNFQMPKQNRALISFEDVHFLSGGGATLEYAVNDDKSVNYLKAASVWRS